MDFIEKRRLPRKEVRWPVRIMTEGGPVDGEARNITVEGIFIRCAERLQPNETYQIMIKLPEDSIEILGKLVWSNLASFGERGQIPGMGFCFMKVSEEDRNRLGKAIAACGDKS